MLITLPIKDSGRCGATLAISQKVSLLALVRMSQVDDWLSWEGLGPPGEQVEKDSAGSAESMMAINE